ncbi:ABC transporter ATP-binding protein [Aeromicrobium sp. P5_D10]
MMPTGPSPAARLQARGVTIGYDHEPVVRDLSLDVMDGSVTAIIGPNGCGKSTLLRSMARLMAPASGEVLLDGEPISSVGSKEVARRMALLPQTPIAPDGLRVADLVARGRHPHQKWFQQWSPEDEAAVDEALAWTDITELKDRSLDRLSGGQRQRVWIAMALAQDTGLLLLDEPTTYLDLAHQVEVLDLVARLNRDRGRTVVMVLHDLNLAARYADVIVVMHRGRVVAEGSSSIEVPGRCDGDGDQGVATGTSVAGSPSAAAASCGT